MHRSATLRHTPPTLRFRLMRSVSRSVDDESEINNNQIDGYFCKMIEVIARLSRGHVYLCGETLECMIIFRNPGAHPSVRAQSNSDVCETLAWASAQIHCQCATNDDRVQFPTSSQVVQEEVATSNRETSFAPCKGERGRVVLATKPKILFCDVRLLPGESRTFVYRETIPCDSPPSYRGQAVKYSYKITIGTQRVGSTIRLLRVPIRVLVLNNVADVGVFTESGDLSPSNPFHQSHNRETLLDAALQYLQNLTARKAPNFYSITNNHGKVVRFCLFKLAYKIGEDIIGTFDFTDAGIKCVQFSVTLQSEEVIAEGCRRKSHQTSTVISYSKVHEFCLYSQHTHIVLPIPLTVTPAFITDVASLNWRLHFEFVTTTTMFEDQSLRMESENCTWQAPPHLDIETMVWDLPIKIYPTNPLQLLNAVHGITETSLCI